MCVACEGASLCVCLCVRVRLCFFPSEWFPDCGSLWGIRPLPGACEGEAERGNAVESLSVKGGTEIEEEMA